MLLLELLNKPKEFVAQCQKHLDELGFNQTYDYDRFIEEELGELVNNYPSRNYNRALLVDDIVDSMWVVLAKINKIEMMYICLDCKITTTLSIEGAIFKELICIAECNSIHWMNALFDLVEENFSKLNFPTERRQEVFRDGKLNKKDPQGNLYPWYTPADFTKF